MRCELNRECDRTSFVTAEGVERAEGNLGPMSVECQKNGLIFLAKLSCLDDKRGCPMKKNVHVHSSRVAEGYKGVAGLKRREIFDRTV